MGAPSHSVLVAVEASDGELHEGGAADAACSTWLSQLPRGSALVFADTESPASASCEAAGVAVVGCCPGNASLGDALSTAQYKREHVLMNSRLRQALLASPRVRWVVSTEQDAWWHVPRLLDLLHAVDCGLRERMRLGGKAGGRPSGHVWPTSSETSSLGDRPARPLLENTGHGCASLPWARRVP